MRLPPTASDTNAVRLHRILCVTLTAAVLAATAGCQPWPGTAPAQRADDVLLEPNIIEVIPHYSLDPFGPCSGAKTSGFKIAALYLAAPGPKGYAQGVFADGIIHVFMYVIEPGAEGKTTERRLAREWIFDPEQARPYRAKKRTVQGYGYFLQCCWGDADVLGKKIDIEVQFERRDGRVVRSAPRRFTVPTT